MATKRIPSYSQLYTVIQKIMNVINSIVCDPDTLTEEQVTALEDMIYAGSADAIVIHVTGISSYDSIISWSEYSSNKIYEVSGPTITKIKVNNVEKPLDSAWHVNLSPYEPAVIVVTFEPGTSSSIKDAVKSAMESESTGFITFTMLPL